MQPMNQALFARMYNDKYREQFNPVYFQRDNQEIMDSIKKVVLSCEKDEYFTLKVKSIREIYDYEEIYNLLREHAETRKKKNAKVDNIFDYINIKDSDIMLLEVKYFVRHNGTEKQEVEVRDEEGKVIRKEAIDVKDPYTILTNLIALPRFVNKYYFRLNGNYYTSTFQIVDGSTYNNANVGGSNKKVDSVTFKNLFGAVKIYRKYRDMIDFYTKNNVRNVVYTSNIFKNFVDGMLYILANYGLYGTFDFLDIHCIQINSAPIDDESWYNFNKYNIFISVPKICQQDPMVQSLISTIYSCIGKETRVDDLFNIRFWIQSLGSNCSTGNALDKGLFVLNSVDGVYDKITQEQLHLPDDQKVNIFYILRWLMREFTPLYTKDNIDVTIKRVRIGEYIAHVYATKLARGLQRALESGKRITLNGVIKNIRTDSMYVINNIINMSNLVSYVDLVNDNDATLAMKFTYKGISGLGENGANVQTNYRYVDPSHTGIIDLDTSGASDPGMSGMICPMAPMVNQSFTNYKEPMTWQDKFKPFQTEWKEQKQVECPFEIIDQEKFKESNSLFNYNSLRRKVIDESLQIDRINCPIYNIYDPNIDYSSASSLLNNEKDHKPESLFEKSNRHSIILSNDDEEGGSIENDDDEW